MTMRGYGRDEYEDVDEYEEDYEDEDGTAEDENGAAEDEYEEEETRQPTEQELEYLELRQRLKASIRKQMKKDSGSLHNSHEKRNKLPYDNYGSFFGPSQPVIAQRVIEESKSLLENPHLAERVSKPKHSGDKVHAFPPQGSRPQVNGHPPKVTNALKTKTKVQILKNTRDYSFLLSDDAELPAPKKDPLPRNVAVPRPEARLAQLPQRSVPTNNVKKVPNARDERRALPAARQIQSEAGPQKSTSICKRVTSVDYQKRHSSNNGSGNGRPQASKNLPSKIPTISKERKIIPPSAKSSIPVVRKPISSKPQLTIPKQTLDRRKQLQESSKGKLPARQPMSSNPQTRQPQAKVPSRPSSHQERPKKRPARQYSDDEDEDGGEAISMIRKMFGYNPKRYVDDDDISDMEANFDQIQREELYSGRIARREDEEELLKIEEEERRERMRKEKKRKLSR